MRSMEKLQWPEPPMVDLVSEFHWIVGDLPTHEPSAASLRLDSRIATLKATSPYTQLFDEAHRSKIVLTTAQKAERRIRSLSVAMEEEISNQCETKKRKQYVQSPMIESVQGPSIAFDLAVWQEEAKLYSSSVPVTPFEIKSIPELKPSKARPSPPKEFVLEDKGDELPPREFPDDPWITAELASPELTEGYNLEIKESHAQQTPSSREKYSMEMQQRIHETIYSHLGEGLWADHTTSQLAHELDAEIVFGVGSEGNSKPFVEIGQGSDDGKGEAEWIQAKSAQVYDLAEKQEAVGSIQEAIATFDEGVQAMLQGNGATKPTWGFNYSLQTHHHATSIQVIYRRRYKKLTTAAIQLSRHWRGYLTRRRLAQICWAQHQGAKCIQRWWSQCTAHKEAMRLRLQTAMRGKLARKHVNERRQHKKLKRNLRLFIRSWQVKNNSLQKQRRKHGYAHYCGLTIDRWIRGYLARYCVRRMKREMELHEAERYASECNYIEQQLPLKQADFIHRLQTTEATRQHRLAMRLQIAAKEREKEWQAQGLNLVELRRLQLHELFKSYDVDESGSIDVQELEYLFQEVGIAIDRKGLDSAIQAMDLNGNGTIDFDEFYTWLHAPRNPSKNLRERQELLYLKMKLSVKHFMNRFTTESYQAHGKRLLVHQENERNRQNLRSHFRRKHPPSYACRYCELPFPLYKSFWSHERQCPKNLLGNGRGHSVDEDEALRASLEQQAVDEALSKIPEAVASYIETKPGKRVFTIELQRVKQLHKTPLVTQLDPLRELFLTYDLDDSNTLEYKEWKQLTLDLGFLAEGDTITSNEDGNITFESFISWYNSIQKKPKTCKSKLKQLWNRLFHGTKRRRRAEAIRYLVAREKIFAEKETRRAFRLVYPPLYACSECDAAFCRLEVAELGSKNGEAIHSNQRTKQTGCHQRIGMHQETKSILETAKRDAKEMDIQEAIRRYIESPFGQRAVESTFGVLLSQQNTPSSLIRSVLSMHSCLGLVSVTHLAQICQLVHLHLGKQALQQAKDALDPQGMINIPDEKLLEWIQYELQQSPVRRWRSLNRCTKKMARMAVAGRYRCFMSLGGFDGNPMDIEEAIDKHHAFDSYAATSEGRAESMRWSIKLHQAMTKIQEEDPRKAIESIGRILFDSMSGQSTLMQNEILFALSDMQTPLIHESWSSPSSAITFDEFSQWFSSIGMFLLNLQPLKHNILTRGISAIRRKHDIVQLRSSALGRMVIAVYYIRSLHRGISKSMDGTLREADKDTTNLLPKSENYAKSMLGKTQLKREIQRIKNQYTETFQRQNPSTEQLITFAFQTFNCPLVTSSDVQAIMYFAGYSGEVSLSISSNTTLPELIEWPCCRPVNDTSSVQTKLVNFRRFARPNKIKTLAAAVLASNTREHQRHASLV